MSAPRTVAVLGGGHNALVAAVRLARAGLDVTVLEQAPEPGGCLWTQVHESGVVLERGAWEHGGVRGVADELGLAEHGLVYREHPLLAGFVFGDGTRRLIHSSLADTLSGLAADGGDAAAYAALAERAGALFAMLEQFPTPPTLTEIAATLAPLRGGDELFRSLLMSAETLLTTALQDPYLTTALGLYASHAQVPWWAPGSGMMALLLPGVHDHPAARPEGGSGALTAALVAALEAAGGRVRTTALVTVVRSRGATGVTGVAGSTGTGGAVVTLADGAELVVDAVVSSLDLVRTADLVADPVPRMRTAATGLHSGALNISELTVSLVSSIPLDLPALDVDPDAVWFAIDRPEDLGRSFGHVLAGETPRRPWSMVGRVAQPAGVTGAALWLSSVVPVVRSDGPWTPELERAAGEHVVDQVSAVLGTDLRANLVEMRVSGPGTWRRRLGGDGNPNHLDNTVDQLFGWRPPGHADLRTELDWLYLCGAGQHPGGGLGGASGLAVADAVLTPAGRGGTGPLARLTGEVRGLSRGLAAYRTMRKGTLR